MKTHSPVIIAILLSTTFLAGCIGGEDSLGEDDDTGTPAHSGEATVTATTGAIKGTAASLDFEPLAGARISLLTIDRAATNIETLVARDGTYALGNLQPDSYIVHITALGYTSQQRPAVVKAGEITEVDFKLTELKVAGPWVHEQEWVGKITFSAAWQVEPPGVGCIVIDPPAQSCGHVRVGSDEDNGEVSIESGPTAKTLTAALEWTSAGALGDNLKFDLMCIDTPRGTAGVILDPEHPCYFVHEKTTSPIVFRIDEAHWLEHGYNFTGDWAARVFGTYGLLGTHPLIGVDVGAAYEQSFKIYAAVFHEAPAPEGYNIIPDA